MENVVPPSLLFEFRLPISRCATASTKAKGSLLNLPESAKLFLPSALNDSASFAEVKAGWHDDGLALQFAVVGRSSLPEGWGSRVASPDCWTVWIDTRPSGNVHKATEYCHCFSFLPIDVESDGQPSAKVQPIAQQRATRIESNVKKFGLRLHTNSSGYQLEVWIPGDQLYGYREISELGRLGFYCVINDSELGTQHFGVGDDFPTSYDPSTWTQLELTK